MTQGEKALILTLLLDPETEQGFETQRRLYFPEHLNVVPAHVTLFHQLPGQQVRKIQDDLAALCRAQNAMPVRVTGVRNLGRGVAYRLESAAARAFRNALSQAWQPWLTPQDRQTWQAHVTIQNKVDPRDALELYSTLLAQFQPRNVQAMGVQLWRYLDGPWEPLHAFPFTAAPV